MSLIKGAIPKQGFEILRDRICQIIAEELSAQFLLSGDYDLQYVPVYMERMVPFDVSELPALNVGIERGDYSNQHQGHADADYRFFIECNTLGEFDVDKGLRGDTASKLLVQKIMGKVRAILENPVYKTLGFSPNALVRHRHIEGFVFAEHTRQDAESATMSRMILVVKSIETTELIEANLILGWDTVVKLFNTEQGYYWSKPEEQYDSGTFDYTYDNTFD